MESKIRYEGTRQTIRTNWPTFVFLYAAVIAALILIGIGFVWEWYAFVPFALAIMIVSAYFLLANFWAAHTLYDTPGSRPIDCLYALSLARPTHHIAFIDLGTRSGAIFVARHLTTGVVFDIDVYNPESNPSGALRRRRRFAPRAPHDPRLRWVDGTATLLPLPDASVDSVFLDQVLSEFLLAEERHLLLAEVKRILATNGRLVLSERLRTQTNLLVLGPLSFTLPTQSDLEAELHRAGLEIVRTEELHGLLTCWEIHVPGSARARQLALNLEYR